MEANNYGLTYCVAKDQPTCILFKAEGFWRSGVSEHSLLVIKKESVMLWYKAKYVMLLSKRILKTQR